MGCQATVKLGANLTFSVMTHDPDTGVLTDADAVPDYRIYEDETAAPILTGSMAKLDDAGTLGFYTQLIACTSGNGFEVDKSYTIYIIATVDGDQGGISFTFTVEAATPEVNATQVEGGDATDALTAAAAAALTTYDPPTKAEMDTGHGLLATEAKQDIIDTVVDAIKAVTDNLPNAGALNDLATILADTNELQSDNIPGLLATIDGIVDAILVDTGTTLPGEHAALTATLATILTDTGTTLQAELDGIQADTEDIQSRLPAALIGGRIDAYVGAMADNVITAAKLAANAITAAKIAASAITSGKFAAGAIDANAIAANAITAVKIAADAITSAKIAADAIGSSELADGAITAAKIATNAIDADALAADAVDLIWDEVLEATLSARGIMRLVLASVAGKATVSAGNVRFRDVADSKDRLNVDHSAIGARTAVTRDAS